MAFIFETIHTEGIAELSYLLGDDSEGVAAVFDPTPDVEKYLTLAQKKKVSITHIFETHIHADLVSGSRELCERVQSAKIYASHEENTKYGFDHEKIVDGDQFAFGCTLITVRHTPGHTPEHVSFVLAEKKHADTPWGVLTGDSLFVNSAGRPDLLGSGQTEELTKKLFHTLRDYYLTLPDSVMIFPAHGHGSPCGADIGDRLQSTIGYERKFNPYLQIADFEKFKEHALGGAPPVPDYYPRMKKVNARGPEVLGNLPRVPALPPKIFKEAVEKREGVLVDTRSMLAFGGGHIPGALNIGGVPMLSIWAGFRTDVVQADEAVSGPIFFGKPEQTSDIFSKHLQFNVGGVSFPHLLVETVNKVSNSLSMVVGDIFSVVAVVFVTRHTWKEPKVLASSKNQPHSALSASFRRRPRPSSKRSRV